jgi:hypothetical protein
VATTEPERGTAPSRRTYPYLNAKTWWDLRRTFRANMPKGVVDAGYLSGVLGIGDRAAGNIVPSLRTFGLIDDAGRPTDRANDWRDDERYRDITMAMLEEVYPQALRDIAPPPRPDREAVERWFMRETRAGEAAAANMARLYLLLALGDPTGEVAAGDRPKATRQQGSGSGREQRPKAAPKLAATRPAIAPQRAILEAGEPQTQAAAASPNARHATPSVHIDIQVHIDPAATAEQIDQIFASMARHLYGRE